jgi:geranylgeranyl diphosphate synthase type II
MSDYTTLIENALKKRFHRLEFGNYYPKNLIEAMKYSTLGGGKRLRARLVLEFCELAHGNPADALSPACAIEMIHAFSLIHDDLPAMDDDDLRRGKASCHKKFGEATAILAGDALSIFAFETISNSKLRDDLKVRIISILSQMSGVQGMCGGQDTDISGAKDFQEHQFMVKRKTGALFVASCLMGVISALNAPEGVKFAKNGNVNLERFAVDFGRNFGVAFQIMDDILDVTATTEELGKPVFSDKEQGKRTFVDFLGLEGAKKEVLDKYRIAMQFLDDMEYNGYLRTIWDNMVAKIS